ncbi:MAG TPA: ATP-binding protein [Chitinophagaceae bacterium]
MNPYLSSRQATILAIIFLVATILLNGFLPGYTVITSGFLVVIFMSVFVEGRSSTIIAGFVCGLVALAFMIWERWSLNIVEAWTKYLFILVLIFLTTLLVLYIKRIVGYMEMGRSHMTSLFENATEGIILTNNLGQIILVNPAALRVFGYTEEELIEQNIEILLPKKYRAGHVHLRDGFYQAPQNRVMGSGRDLYGQRKNGENFPVEVSLSAYKQQEKQYVIAFIVDITHRKEIERSMLKQQQQLEKVTNDVRRMNAELEAKVEERTVILKEALQRLEQSQAELSESLDKERQLNEIKSRFVSMASHEFRTPLSAVLSSASLIGKYTTTEQQPNRDKHINRIKESVKHLNDLLEDFLSLGKLDEGKVGAAYSEVDLEETIKDTLDDLRGLVKEGQDLNYDHVGESVIESDKKLLKNILINLVSNAIKFSDPHKEIRIASKVTDHHATISVTDQGIGISEEDQGHLFTSFFRGKNALNIQGTGLGLHIVHRYVELLNGTVNLQSELGKGTTITFTIPIKKGH